MEGAIARVHPLTWCLKLLGNHAPELGPLIGHLGIVLVQLRNSHHLLDEQRRSHHVEVVAIDQAPAPDHQQSLPLGRLHQAYLDIADGYL